MQGIFYFQGESEPPCDLYFIATKCESFPCLNIPWRWKNSNPYLGDWLNKLREILEEADKANQGVSLSMSNPCNYISYISPKEIFNNLPKTSSEQQTIAFIARNEKIQSFFNRRTGGRYAYHEKKDNEQLTNIIKNIDSENETLSFYIEIYKMFFSHVTDNLSTLKDKLDKNDLSNWNCNKYAELLKLFQELRHITNVDNQRIARYSKVREILKWIKNKDEFPCIRHELYNKLIQVIDHAILNNISLEECNYSGSF